MSVSLAVSPTRRGGSHACGRRVGRCAGRQRSVGVGLPPFRAMLCALVGHISTRDGNQPFINPTSFWYNEDSHEIYFHSNAHGRMRFNADNNPEACFECFSSGRLLPSNLALEVSFQYKCVIAFGEIRVIEKMNEKRNVLNGLLQKYFGEMKPGKDYRPITDDELKQTSVYGIKIDSWSGKRNWRKNNCIACRGSISFILYGIGKKRVRRCYYEFKI